MKSNAPPTYDTLLSGGTVIDGTGNDAYQADLAIEDDRIVAIGDLHPACAAQEIDVRGKCIAPGFIDTHTHDDHACMSASIMEPKISQGVTTVVVGNCGVSLAPLDQPPAVPEPINLLGEPGDRACSTSICWKTACGYSSPGRPHTQPHPAGTWTKSRGSGAARNAKPGRR